MIYKYALDGTLLNKYKSYKEAEEDNDISSSSVRRAIQGEFKNNKSKGFIWKEKGLEVYESKEGFKAFLQREGLDEDSVKGLKIWQTQKGEVRYSVSTGKDEDNEKKLKIFKDKFFEDFDKYKEPVHKIKYNKQRKICGIINLFDAHLDKMVLLEETNNESSFENNIKIFEQAFDELLETCISFNPELIILPVGNDVFTTNGPCNTTVRGTPQDVSVKSEDSFIGVFNMYRRCIDKAYKYCKVLAPVIRSNHSEDKDFYLGECLTALYEKNKNVEIDNTRHKRRYIQYGENMFGLAHGDVEVKKIDQLPLIMAEEQKQMWADTSFREWFLGDRHHKFEYKFLRIKDFIGCTVRFLRSISNNDKWHYDQGYLGIPKTAELFIYDKEKGPKGNFMVHVK